MTTASIEPPAHVMPTPSAFRPGEPRRLPVWAREACDDVDLSALAELVFEADLAAAFGDLRENAEFVLRLRASVEENLHHLRQVLTGRSRIGEVVLDEPFALAGLQARLRIQQTALQRSYRVGFTTMWNAWSDRLVEGAERQGVPRTEGLLALRDMTTLLLAYQDHAASQVADSFARMDEAMSRSREHVRNGLVRHLLLDDTPPLAASDLVLLDYPLDAEHVAVLLPELAEDAARQLLPRLRDASHTRHALVHPTGLTSTVVWLAQRRTPGWRPGAVERSLDCLHRAEVVASVSQPLVGLAGIRQGWRQVQDVERVRAAWGAATAPQLLTHDDVSLEILLMADADRARAFVRAELRLLGADDSVASRLRETVEASHRHGSHIVTAEHLHLHEHTVRNRLQKAAELLGRPLTERRTELQVALRLARLLAQADR
jgi:sugar diacid utilization regulator